MREADGTRLGRETSVFSSLMSYLKQLGSHHIWFLSILSRKDIQSTRNVYSDPKSRSDGRYARFTADKHMALYPNDDFRGTVEASLLIAYIFTQQKVITDPNRYAVFSFCTNACKAKDGFRK